MNNDFIPTPPTEAEWNQRRAEYDNMWSEAIHPMGSSMNQHADSLKLEIERCYCAGAYVACVMLSAAIVEVHLSHFSAWKNPKGKNLLEWLNVVDDWEILKNSRNDLIHGVRNPKEAGRLDSDSYRYNRPELKRRAEFAIALSLRIVLNNPEIDTNPLK